MLALLRNKFSHRSPQGLSAHLDNVRRHHKRTSTAPRPPRPKAGTGRTAPLASLANIAAMVSAAKGFPIDRLLWVGLSRPVVRPGSAKSRRSRATTFRSSSPNLGATQDRGDVVTAMGRTQPVSDSEVLGSRPVGVARCAGEAGHSAWQRAVNPLAIRTGEASDVMRGKTQRQVKARQSCVLVVASTEISSAG